MGTIVVSAVTATVVVAAGLYLYVHRGSASPPALAVPAPATAIAAPAPPPAATVAPAASSAASDASAAPAPSADPADLPYGYGYLTVVSPASANVYLSGKIAGPVNQALKVRCGRWFVRLAAPPESRYPDWVSRGETVVVACQELTRLELSRRP
jgi:serine/threonine-protein kinase